MEVVLGIPSLALSNVNFQFGAEKLTWRSYTVAEALFTISRVKLINKRKFAMVALDENLKTFVVHISALNVAELLIHLFQTAQIAAL